MDYKEQSAIVAGWTQAEALKGQMLPKSPERVSAEMESGQYVLLSDKEGSPLSYCRFISWGHDKEWVEVGSLVVDEKHRKAGIGTETVLKTINLAAQMKPEAEIFALTENAVSAALFAKIGGIPISNTELPSEVWDLCKEVGNECKHLGIFPRCFCKPFKLTHLARNNG